MGTTPIYLNPSGSGNDVKYIDGKKCRKSIKLRPLI
jgi:hypothetical protein